MIKVQYRGPNELAPGLHAAAERHGRSTVVYLLPGLTAGQRRAALRRLRLSARRGYGPRLPAAQLALALLADRVRTVLGQAGAAFRSHPAGTTVPVMVVSGGAIAFLALSAVSVQVLHVPRVPGLPPVFGSAPAAPAVGASAPGAPQHGDPGPGASGPASRLVASAQPRPTATGAAGGPGSGGSTAPASPGASGGAAGQPGTSPSAASGSVGVSVDASPAASVAVGVSLPLPAPSPTGSGLCLDLGPLGVCLK